MTESRLGARCGRDGPIFCSDHPAADASVDDISVETVGPICYRA